MDWTEVDDSLDNRPAGFGDEAFLKNIQESFDGALLMVSTGEETRLLIHGSDDYPQTDNVEDLGMTPDMIARRSAFSDVGGVSSLCVYSDLGRDGASLIYVKPLRALFMRCMPHVIMVELSALIIIITLCHYLLTVFRYIDGHRLTKEQARRYHPKQLRRTVVAAGLTGALIIFVSTALPGKTVMEYGLPEKSLADGCTDFATLRGVQSYVTTVRQSDVFFIYIIKNSMLFSNTLPASLAATLAYLVVLSVVLVICLRKYDENAFGKCTFEDGQNPGGAGAQATSEAPEESYGLSELAVNRGRKKVPKEDRTPESRVKSVIKFDIILLIRLPALFSLRDGGTSIGNGTLLQFLMNGDWNGGSTCSRYGDLIGRNAGDYTVTVNAVDGGNYKGTASATWTIAPSRFTVTAKGYSGVYDGRAHGITVDVGESGAQVYYGLTELNANNYSTVGSATRPAPAWTDAGKYTVYYYVVADNYVPNAVRGSRTVFVTKADADATAPRTVPGLVYSGSAQPLVSAGSATGGQIRYALSKEGPFKPELPTGTNAGDYVVYYMTAGDGNHNDSGVGGPVIVRISKAAPTVTAPMARALTCTGSATGGTMLYSTDNVTWSEAVPVGTDSGSYTVYYRVEGDGNHSDVEAKPLTVVIEPKPESKPEPKPEPTPESARPDYTLLAKLKASGTDRRALDLTWTKVKDADGYDIYFVKCGRTPNYKATVNAGDARQYRFTKLKKGASYRPMSGRGSSSTAVRPTSASPAPWFTPSRRATMAASATPGP